MGIFERRVAGCFWYSTYQGPFHQRSPCEHALDASQSDHPPVCFWSKADPGMQVKPESADRLTALLGQPVLADWKNAEGKITCLAPDGINIFLIYTHKYVYYFLFKSVCLSNIFINVIWSVLETFWNMCKCNKATRPGGKIRWIFQLSDRKTVWELTDGGSVICLWALLCAGNVRATCRPWWATRAWIPSTLAPAFPFFLPRPTLYQVPRAAGAAPALADPGPFSSSVGLHAISQSPRFQTDIFLCRTSSELIFCAKSQKLWPSLNHHPHSTPPHNPGARSSCEHIFDISGQFQKKVIIEKYIS